MGLFPNRPNMKKMFDGRGALRPIPVYTDTGTERAIAAAAAEQQPKHGVVNMPSGPRVRGADTVFGSPVAGATKVNGGVHNPASGTGSAL